MIVVDSSAWLQYSADGSEWQVGMAVGMAG